MLPRGWRLLRQTLGDVLRKRQVAHATGRLISTLKDFKSAPQISKAAALATAFQAAAGLQEVDADTINLWQDVMVASCQTAQPAEIDQDTDNFVRLTEVWRHMLQGAV